MIKKVRLILLSFQEPKLEQASLEGQAREEEGVVKSQVLLLSSLVAENLFVEGPASLTPQEQCPIPSFSWTKTNLYVCMYD